MNTILLTGLWQGALITIVAALITKLLPQRHAATRYAVWFSALLALAIIPFATLWHPTQPIETPIASTAIVTATVTAKAATASGGWLQAIWAIGVAFCLGRLALSHHRIGRIVRNATVAPELGDRVLISDELAVPIAAGLFRPAIIIPTHLVTTLERIDLESIVRHERAHIARLDILGNLVQRVIEACLFFNPWVYVIGRQLVTEREAACDDWAVYASGAPDRYASCLAHVAQSVRGGHPPLLTPSAIGSKRMLFVRIARLLNGKATQLKVNYLALASSVLSFAALATLIQAPPVVASPQTSAANCNRFAAVTAPAAPVFPDSARSKLSAPVSAVVNVTVAADGTAVGATITKSSKIDAIDNAAIKAALSSTYSPEMRNCKAVSGHYLFRAEFNPD